MAGDVLLGKEKIQKILLARLTETVVMWLSDEQEFWGVLEDKSAPLLPLGLHQVLSTLHYIDIMLPNFILFHVTGNLSTFISKCNLNFKIVFFDRRKAFVNLEKQNMKKSCNRCLGFICLSNTTLMPFCTSPG